MDLFKATLHSVDKVMRAAIEREQERTGTPRKHLMVDVGKALIMAGCMYLGNALGLDSDQGLQPGRDLLAHFDGIASSPENPKTPESGDTAPDS